MTRTRRTILLVLGGGTIALGFLPPLDFVSAACFVSGTLAIVTATS